MFKKRTLFKALLMGGMVMCANTMLQAQPASLNANKIVQPYYKCWGLLTEGCYNAEKLGWKVGVQYHTFNKHTVFEAIELTRALGLHYIELNLEAKICAESDETITFFFCRLLPWFNNRIPIFVCFWFSNRLWCLFFFNFREKLRFNSISYA